MSIEQKQPVAISLDRVPEKAIELWLEAVQEERPDALDLQSELNKRCLTGTWPTTTHEQNK